MATVVSPPEEKVVLRSVTWTTYEALLADRGETSNPRLTYDRGVLEIMSLSSEHEALKDVVVLLVNALAEEMNEDTWSFGSMTFRREDIARGFEPDACFYVRNLPRVKGKTNLDLTIDPPPDLVIEIDITHSSLDKHSIFAAVGIPEVWRYDGSEWTIHQLIDGGYAMGGESGILPGVDRSVISRFVEASDSSSRPDWLRTVRMWAQATRNNG